jgi:hypothetical protein
MRGARTKLKVTRAPRIRLCVFTVCAPVCAARGLEVCLCTAREGMCAVHIVANFLAHLFLTLFRSFYLRIPLSFHEIDCRCSIAPLNLKLLKNLPKTIKILEDSSVFVRKIGVLRIVNAPIIDIDVNKFS